VIEFKVDQVELKNLVKKLGELEKKARNKITRKVFKTILPEMESAARSNAPQDTGKLASAFVKDTRTRRGNVMGRLRVVAPHAHLMELGWFWRKKKGGKIFHTIGSPYTKGPRPFMRPMLDTHGEKALKQMADALREALSEVGS